jgi:hypothetical protein
MTRGIRNNNPGNINNNSAKPWQGQLLHDPILEPRFCRFESPEYGIRALMKLLCNYYKGGHNSISKIINRYAPSSDNNNTTAYINGVSKALNIDQFAKIDVNKSTLFALSKAIIRHENGKQPYSEDTFEKAFELL